MLGCLFLLLVFADPVAQRGFLHAEQLADLPTGGGLGDVAFLEALEVHAHRALLRGGVVLTGSCHADRPPRVKPSLRPTQAAS